MSTLTFTHKFYQVFYMFADLVVSLQGKDMYQDCWKTKCEGEFIIHTNKCTTYINNILYIAITPTCFNASASS